MPVTHRGLIPMKPTRFPMGLNTSYPTDALAQMGQLDPTRFATDFDDFYTYLATDWTVTLVGAGGAKALVAGNGGILSVTNSAGIADSTYYQRPVAGFLLTANKRAFFKIRCTLNEVIESVFQAGLILTDTTPTDATDGIYFLKVDGSANLQVFVRKDATTGSVTNANVGAMVAGTAIELAWAYDGVDTVEFYINDINVASLAATSTTLPDIALATSFGIGNGEAVAKILTVDYVFAAVER